jgi:hypothetical protein
MEEDCNARREPSRGWAAHPNLRRRPSSPNKGRGRLQQQVRRAFAAAGVSELTSTDIYDWTHARRRKLSQLDRHGVWRVLCEVAVPIGRATSNGRPWIWRLKPAQSAPRPFPDVSQR